MKDNPNFSKNHPFYVHIGRTSGGGEGPKVILQITDRISGIQVVDIEMDPETFVMALTGGNSRATGELYIGDAYGMYTVHKTERVPVEYSAKKEGWLANITEAANKAPFTDDGWIPTGLNETFNHHRYQHQLKMYEVHYIKRIPMTEDMKLNIDKH